MPASMSGNDSSRGSVTVIIPTLNGAFWLEDVFTMLAAQTLCPAEVLVVDSGSTDGTIAIARRYGARIVEIPREDFDHGATRSMAARMATTEILVFMTQDAVPADENALARLVAPLGKNRVAASYGRQLPRRDATVFGRHLRLFNYPAESHVFCFESRQRHGFKTIFISNSFAAYQRDVLLAQGCFDEHLLFGEDTLAVAKMLGNGYCVAYVSEAMVYHSHDYSIVQDCKRYFDIGAFHACQQEHLAAYGGPGGTGRAYVLSLLTMLIQDRKLHLLFEAILRVAGKFISYQLGKRYAWLPTSLARRLSMNSDWWTREA